MNEWLLHYTKRQLSSLCYVHGKRETSNNRSDGSLHLATRTSSASTASRTRSSGRSIALVSRASRITIGISTRRIINRAVHKHWCRHWAVRWASAVVCQWAAGIYAHALELW